MRSHHLVGCLVEIPTHTHTRRPDAALQKQMFSLFRLLFFCPANRAQSCGIIESSPRAETLDNPLCSHRNTHTLDALLHQLAAINTGLLSTCVWSSGIWAALSEGCCCVIRISAGTLPPSPRTRAHPGRLPGSAAAAVSCNIKNLSVQIISFSCRVGHTDISQHLRSRM